MWEVGTLGGGAGAARRGTWTTRAPATSVARATTGRVWYTGRHSEQGSFMQVLATQLVTDNTAEVCYLCGVVFVRRCSTCAAVSGTRASLQLSLNCVG